MSLRPLRLGLCTATWIAAACLAALSACSGIPVVRSDANAGGMLTSDAARLIVVVLDNSSAALRPEAGSTPHGYEPAGAYAQSDRARATATQLARSYGMTALREWPIAPLRVDCLVFRLPANVDRADVLRRLARDRRVQLAQPLQQFATLAQAAEATSPSSTAGTAATASITNTASASNASSTPAGYNDPYLPLQWGFSAMQIAAAQRFSRGQGVTVAVIDTGADVEHPDLAGRVQLARNFVDRDAHAFAADPHGTLVAGIIAAVPNNHLGIVGVSPDARLQIFKACEPVGPSALAAQCNSFTLALALSAAIEGDAQIVNLSLTGPADPLLQRLVVQGQQRGMIFVGAVPPDGSLSGFPLVVPGVVAAQESERAAPAAPVLPAPGNEVLSLTPAGHYDFASGSSFAAAQISGALAVLRAGAPRASASQLLAALRRSVETNPAHGSTVNLCTALAIVQPLDACQPASTRRLADQADRYNR